MNSSSAPKRVLLVGPKEPPYGGVALQARLLQEMLERDGVQVLHLASNLPFPPSLSFCERLRGIRPFIRSAVMCRELWRMADSVDCVHVLACSWLFFFVVVCPAVCLSRLRGKRVVLNYRGGEADEFFRRSAFVARPVFRMADIVTAPSGFLVEVLGRRLGIPVQVVPNVLNENRFRYRRRLNFSPKLIVTRHLLKLYDVECVVRAFALVQNRYPDASLVIAGTGDQEQQLRQIVTDLKLRNVLFTGYVSHDQLARMYDDCDIMLNASRADNFPAALLEAAASGLAIVSTNVGGIPYMLQDGMSALLVGVGDAKAMADAVCRIVAEPEFGQRLASAAWQESQKCRWEYVRDIMYESYGFSRTAGPPIAYKTSSRRQVTTA